MLANLRVEFSKKTITVYQHQYILFISFLYFNFFYFHLFLGGNCTCLHAKSKGNQIEVLALIIIKVQWPIQSRRDINIFSIHFCFIGRVLSIFRWIMDGPISSEMDIKVLIPAPTFFYKQNKCLFNCWKMPNFSSIG